VFIRFVVPLQHEDSHCRTGVFHEAYRLRDRDLLEYSEDAWLKYVLTWFEQQLPVPSRFSRSRRRCAHPQAVCWFKAEATRCIGMVRRMTSILDRHGVATQMLRTKRPGYIIYEDKYQVAAVPFRDTRA
jgi:hypothetical protein